MSILVYLHLPPLSWCRVKYTGLLGLGCVGLLTICDLWQLIADTTIDLVGESPPAYIISTHSLSLSLSLSPQIDLLLHILLRGVYLLGIPLLISLLLFYIHFSILIYSGPGNAFVSKPFRKSLIVSFIFNSLLFLFHCIPPFPPPSPPHPHPQKKNRTTE